MMSLQNRMLDFGLSVVVISSKKIGKQVIYRICINPHYNRSIGRLFSPFVIFTNHE